MTDLRRAWEEPFRVYHTYDNHLKPCLEKFEKIRGYIRYADEFEVALCYHDFICVPGAEFNEFASAERASFDCKRLEFNEEFISQVRALILAEKMGCSNDDEKIFIDLDYSILGESGDTYDRYARGIRQEYSFASDFDFEKGRTHFLRKLLKRKSIFRHFWFRQEYEKRALDNVLRELSEPRLIYKQ
jgi:predicted metal-dependent HD superfamily phosphohydrolase